MKVYVASSFLNKDEVRKAERTLRDNGFEVTSRWVDHTGEDLNSNLKHEAIADLEDVFRADCILVIWPSAPRADKWAMRGTCVELGMALGRGMLVYFLSEQGELSLFYAHLPHIRHIKSVEEFMERCSERFYSWQENQ